MKKRGKEGEKVMKNRGNKERSTKKMGKKEGEKAVKNSRNKERSAEKTREPSGRRKQERCSITGVLGLGPAQWGRTAASIK